MLAVVLLLCAQGPSRLLAQHTFTGIVLDAETGQPLPAAGIRVVGTWSGTITNVDGLFSLEVPQLPATIAFRYVGYQSAEVELTPATPSELRITLERSIVPLDEVVVTGENPAIAIMRRVIARKSEMQAALDSYTADAYNRFTISNDTGIVSIIESFTKAFWRKGEGLREVSLKQETTVNLPLDDVLPAAMLVTNLYDDDIELSGYTMPGVTHPDALSLYRFYLVDHLYMDDQLVYEIRVEPRGKRRVGFKGSIRVLAGEWVMLEVNLTPGQSFLFPPPIEGMEVVMYQQFTDFGDGVWLPSDLHAKTSIKIGFGKLLTFPEIGLDQLSRLTNYRVNAPTPDSLFKQEAGKVLSTDSTYAESYFDALGVPLTEKETEAYNTIDSTLTLESAFKPGGVFGRSADLDFSFGDDSTSGPQSRFTRDLTPHIHFNRVEALRIGGLASIGSSGTNGFRLKGGASYMTARKEFSYRIGAGVFFGQGTRLNLSVDYADVIAPRYDSQVFDELVNSALVLLGRKDYFDYLSTRSVMLSTKVEYEPLQSSAEFGFDIEQHESVATATSYDLLGRDEPQPVNPMVAEGDMRAFRALIVINDRDNPASITGIRSLRLHVRHSSPGLGNSDFDFTTGKATLDWRLETFGRRRLIPQALDFRVVGFASSGTVPSQGLRIVDTSSGVYTPFGSLRAGGVRPFEGDRGLAMFWEHNFRTSIFEMLGAWSLAREGITFSVFGAHATTEVSDSSSESLFHVPRTTQGWYHEAGVSVGGLLGILRLDVAKRLDAPGLTVGVAAGRLF